MNRKVVRAARIAGSVGTVVALAMILSTHPQDRAQPAIRPAAAPTRAMPTVAARPTIGGDPEQSMSPARAAVIGAVTAGFGLRMVAGGGVTVYVFSADGPGRSTCTDACAARWAPVRSLGGMPKAGAGVLASAVGSIQRPDGSDQVTIFRRPLYYFSGDTAKGAANGQGRVEFGGVWSAVLPSSPLPPGTAKRPS